MRCMHIMCVLATHRGDPSHTSNIWISRLRSNDFLVRSFEWRGLRFHRWKTCMKWRGLPWKRVGYVWGLPWKLVWSFGNRNYFKADLLRLWYAPAYMYMHACHETRCILAGQMVCVNSYTHTHIHSIVSVHTHKPICHMCICLHTMTYVSISGTTTCMYRFFSLVFSFILSRFTKDALWD